MKIKFAKDDVLVIMHVVSMHESRFTILGDESLISDEEIEMMESWTTPEGWEVV